MKPEFSLIAEDKDNIACGFVFAVDNIFEREKKSLIIKSLSKLPDVKYKGLGSLLTEMIHKLAFKNYYDELFHALMHEKNKSQNILSDDSQLYHSYSLFW